MATGSLPNAILMCSVQEAKAFAERLLAEGAEEVFVVKMTGLSIEQVRALQR